MPFLEIDSLTGQLKESIITNDKEYELGINHESEGFVDAFKKVGNHIEEYFTKNH